MASLDPAEKAKGIEIFRHGIDICAELGWGIVNLVPHWPLGLKAPIPYVPSYIYPIARGAARMPSPKLRMTLPEPFDFDAIWRNYVDSLVIATELAAEREVKLALEGHAHVIVSGTDAMPRLLDEVSNPALVVKTSNAQFKEAGRDLGSSRKTIHSGGRAGWSASRRRPIATGRFVPTMTSSAAGCDGCSSHLQSRSLRCLSLDLELEAIGWKCKLLLPKASSHPRGSIAHCIGSRSGSRPRALPPSPWARCSRWRLSGDEPSGATIGAKPITSSGRRGVTRPLAVAARQEALLPAVPVHRRIGQRTAAGQAAAARPRQRQSLPLPLLGRPGARAPLHRAADPVHRRG
jgi:hypothetical protein